MSVGFSYSDITNIIEDVRKDKFSMVLSATQFIKETRMLYTSFLFFLSYFIQPVANGEVKYMANGNVITPETVQTTWDEIPSGSLKLQEVHTYTHIPI